MCIKHPRTGKVERDGYVVKIIGSKSVLLDNEQKWHVSKISQDHSVTRDCNDQRLVDLSDIRRKVHRSETVYS